MNKPMINNEKQLKKIYDYLSKMPSLSTTVTKVLAVCNSPTSSANDLNRVVSLDPVLTGNVLKLINSAYYSMRNPVTSLTKAIMMLGLNTIKNLAINTAILGTLGGKGTSNALSMDAFWAHSLCVGVTAKSIAAVVGVRVTDSEEYFVSGLLHDLGKIPLLNCFPGGYLQVMEISNQKKIPLSRSETLVFGINHCEIGKLIAQKWKLSGAMFDAICYHHDLKSVSDENQRVVHIVALADIYAKAIETELSDEVETPKAYVSIEESASPKKTVSQDPDLKALLKKVDISWNSLSEMKGTILEEIEKAKVFLQIARKG